MLRPKVRYRLPDILAFKDGRGLGEIPNIVELAARLAVVETRLANLTRQKSPDKTVK